jgi:type II secretory pathway pseudopilin PulG
MICCKSSRTSRPAVSLVELLIVIFVVAVVIGLLLPGLQHSRISANQSQSQNNLRQMGLAVVNMAVTNNGVLPQSAGAYPKVTTGSSTLFYWMLPYIEQVSVYDLGNLKIPNDAVVSTFLVPTDPSVVAGSACTSYASNSLVFTATPVRASAVPLSPRVPLVYYPMSITDGTANTIILMERYAQAYSSQAAADAPNAAGAVTHYWNRPTALTTYLTPTETSGVQFAPSGLAADNTLPQGMALNGINVALADGSVRLVASNISAKT